MLLFFLSSLVGYFIAFLAYLAFFAFVLLYGCFTTFQNGLTLLIKATRAYSIHPRGVWYDKSNEGYMYDDQTKSSKKYDDAVYPGSQYTYEWFVPDEMSPTDQDPPCVARLYSSTVDPVKDMYSGIFDP